MEAKGVNGTVGFDGAFVTIQRKGFLARATVGKGDKRIPVGVITAVQVKPPGKLGTRGFIQFTVPGGIEQKNQFGTATFDAASDENSVLFSNGQSQAFEHLRTAIEAAIHQRHAPPPLSQPMPAPTVQFAPPATASPTAGESKARLAELKEMREDGLISDAEFEAKKAQILQQM